MDLYCENSAGGRSVRTRPPQVPKALADRNHTYHRVVGDGKPALPTVAAMWGGVMGRWHAACGRAWWN